ncbi:unnamed protein product [Heligmosomoides polygyrus]|uniref:Sushi domain-containing protein n=1 Tax=Heligmosomoides polygyrus TaxID=6339 RepID=A0A183FW92_HELPZ|nr:unnamed protein product [Heligmosomoides polygyrus]
MCDFDELRTRRRFLLTMLVPRPSKPTNWQKHLGQATGKCYLEHIPHVDSWTFTCRDGVWYPQITCITPDW